MRSFPVLLFSYLVGWSCSQTCSQRQLSAAWCCFQASALSDQGPNAPYFSFLVFLCLWTRCPLHTWAGDSTGSERHWEVHLCSPGALWKTEGVLAQQDWQKGLIRWQQKLPAAWAKASSVKVRDFGGRKDMCSSRVLEEIKWFWSFRLADRLSCLQLCFCSQ